MAAEIGQVDQARAPYDRMKRGYDEFSEPQAAIESWADAEGGENFQPELADMRVSDVRALMDTAANVADEHDRRARRARKVRNEVQAFMLEAANVPPSVEAEAAPVRQPQQGVGRG